MQFSFSYNKKKVLQGLRYHFITRNEIRILLILVNVFAIFSAILFYTKKIAPEPFLLSTVLWLFLMVSFWYILPQAIYARSGTFKDKFTIFILDKQVRLQSPHFFHLYFSSKSFFLLPKDEMPPEVLDAARVAFGKRIKRRTIKTL